ncbi:MAG TPA: hypothetical protein VM871_05490, partial [Flavisolibacter sp.]|nr:hypothetical protein [Flavisolibacter sp.]
MKTPCTIFFCFLMACAAVTVTYGQNTKNGIDFFGQTVQFPVNFQTPPFPSPLSPTAIQQFLSAVDTTSLQPYLDALRSYKKANHPDDWLYYQLVRKVAQYISPKAVDYHRYTFYKWWLLSKSGYDALLAVSGEYLLFYVQCDENIYNIPFRVMEGRQYVCLNYHDYGSIDFGKNSFVVVPLSSWAGTKPFSYKVSHLPDFSQSDYAEREVEFSSGLNRYSFRVKLNPKVKAIFTNYPVVDYDLQFNVPLSRPTYESLIPSLKKEVK